MTSTSTIIQTSENMLLYAFQEMLFFSRFKSSLSLKKVIVLDIENYLNFESVELSKYQVLF